MRIKPVEIDTIKQCLYQIDQYASVYLFGSRIDDTKKGGDIDLLIISNDIDFSEKLQLKICITNKLGEQKIDLLISPENKTSFARLVLESAIKL